MKLSHAHDLHRKAHMLAVVWASMTSFVLTRYLAGIAMTTVKPRSMPEKILILVKALGCKQGKWPLPQDEILLTDDACRTYCAGLST